jgi:hypothetical protein
MAFNSRNNLSSEPRKIIETPWVRPSDWPVITDAPNEIQVLLNDTNRATYWFDFYYAGIGATVDWGDGSPIENLPNGGSGTMARVNHTYTPGTGATCSLGYTTFVAKFSHATSVGKVYPSAVGSSGTAGLAAPDGTLLNGFYSWGILEMYMGDNCYDFNYTDMFWVNAIAQSFNQLTYVKFPRNITGDLVLSRTFWNSCYALKKVDLPETVSGSVNLFSAFRGCVNLTNIKLPETPGVGITNMQATFINCRTLTDIKFPSHLNNLVSLNSTFENCTSLIYVDIPPMPNNLNYGRAFSGCSNLQSFTFKELPNRTSGYGMDFQLMFQNCDVLENVEFPGEWINGEFAGQGNNFNVDNMFSTCRALRGITYPKNWLPTNAINTHLDCINLQYVDYQRTLRPANWTSHFSGCRSLKAVYTGGEKNVINAIGALTLNGTFFNCVSLYEMKISTIDGASQTDIRGCFQGCTGLVYADISEITLVGGNSGISQLNSCFNGCIILKSVLFQDTLHNVTDFTGAFAACNSLEEFTMPNTLIATNYLNCFANCHSLQKFTFGTTGTGSLSGIGSMFANCHLLKEVDLSPLLNTSGKAAAITSLSPFNNCYSLETINMGSFQLSGVTSIGGFISGCASLETVIGIEKVGNTSTSAGTYLPWGLSQVGGTPQLKDVVISSRVSLIALNGAGSTPRHNLQTLRLANHSTGQFTGTAIAIQIQWCNMAYAALINLFNDLAAKPNVTGRSINITGNPGVASLTAADRLIITSKGWTIIS